MAYGIRFTRHSVHFIFRESGPERDRSCGKVVTRSRNNFLRRPTTMWTMPQAWHHVVESRHQENNVRKGHQDRPRFNACGSQSSLWPHPAQTCTRSPAARKKKPCSIEAISRSHGCVAGAQTIHYKRDARNREGRSRSVAAPASSGPDQNQQAHGYSQRIGLEHKARLRSSRSEGAHQLPLLLLSSLSRDVSPTRSLVACQASPAFLRGQRGPVSVPSFVPS